MAAARTPGCKSPPAPAASAPVAETKKAAPEAKDTKKKKAAAGKGKKVQTKKLSIDCSEPVDDDIFDIASYEKFLHDRIKIGGKTGVLGENITVAREGNVINVTAKVEFSKRYLKYLTKKFLKKQLLRDYIRVIARTKTSYHLRYFNFNQDGEEGAAAGAAAE